MADKTIKFSCFESTKINITQMKEDGFYYSLPKKNPTDRVLHHSVAVGPSEESGYFVAVLDGHGHYGGEIALLAVKKLPKLIKKSLKSITKINHPSIFKAVQEVLKTVSKEVEEQTDFDTQFSGCTLCASLVMTEHVYTWQIGDSLALMFNENDGKFTAKKLCTRHTLRNLGEKFRIQQSNGRIAKLEYEDDNMNATFGVERIYLQGESYHSLIKTRTIGDKLHHKHCAVTDEPEMSHLKINYNTRYLVWITDEYLKADSLTDFLQAYYGKDTSLDKFCKEILDFCLNENVKARNPIKDDSVSIRDDISVVIVKINDQELRPIKSKKK